MFDIYLFLLKNLKSKWIIFDILVQADPEKYLYKNVPFFIFKKSWSFTEIFKPNKICTEALINKNKEILSFVKQQIKINFNSIYYPLCIYGTKETAEIFINELNNYHDKQKLFYLANNNFAFFDFIFNLFGRPYELIFPIAINDLNILKYYFTGRTLSAKNTATYKICINKVSEEIFDFLFNKIKKKSILLGSITNFNMFRKFVESGVKISENQFYNIYINGNMLFLNYLEKERPDSVKTNIPTKHVILSNIKIINFSTRNGILFDKNGSLINASEKGRYKVCEILLKLGADPSTRDSQAVKNCLKFNYFNIFKLFHEKSGIEIKKEYLKKAKSAEFKNYIKSFL